MPVLSSDAERKRKQRADERDLRISRIKEPNRRLDCLADPYQFMPTYFEGVFYQPFTVDRREMIDAILHAARYGGDQAVAGPRADGKTRSALFCTLALMLGGFVSFPMVISKSGPRANRELRNLKEAVRDSESFREDFPEVAEPILDLGGWSSRARQQTAFTIPTHLEWGEECIVFPTITTEVLRENGWNEGVESAARGQIMASLGIEGPIRGYSIRNRRPDLAILDDIDDRESARSESQTANREHIIEEDVGGLAGPDKTIARVMLCTLINRTCNAAKFTDRTQKPSWRGQRHKLLLEMPDRMDLWEEYIHLRKSRTESDPDARQAHHFYLANREAMDAGAIVTNEHRLDSRLLLDGEQSEASALQACFNLIADRGWDHFNTEYQNDPPDISGLIESGITPKLIQKQVNGFPKGVIPPGCTVLTHTCDVGKLKGFHWVVRAWQPNGTPHVIDYGVMSVKGVKFGTDEGLERAIFNAVVRRMDEFKSAGYATADGETIRDSLSTFDARWQTDAVLAGVAAAGMGVRGIIGIGKSAGCVVGSFRDVVENSATRRKCGTTGAYEELHVGPYGKLWVIHANADKWKGFEHDRWMTPNDKPGCAFLFGEGLADSDRLSADERAHEEFAKQICAEIEVEEGHKRKWIPRGKENDYLDASWHGCCAAACKGIRVIEGKNEPKPRVPLNQMGKK